MFPWFTYAAIIFGMVWVGHFIFARICTWRSHQRMIPSDFMIISIISLGCTIIACMMVFTVMYLGIFPEPPEPPAIERIYFEE